MEILEELKYYCELNNPVGAVLLTGEWGCGKTYFVEHTLKEALDSTHIIIRISLFGVSRTEEIVKKIKKGWLDAKKYIDLMEKNPDEAFRICMGMKFDTFDEEMANATIQAYEKADNRHKISIVNNFKDMWMIYQPFDKTEKVRIRFYEGFEYMEKRLDSLLEKYEDKKISRQHTKDFISDIEAFLKSSIKES